MFVLWPVPAPPLFFLVRPTDDRGSFQKGRSLSTSEKTAGVPLAVFVIKPDIVSEIQKLHLNSFTYLAP